MTIVTRFEWNYTMSNNISIDTTQLYRTTITLMTDQGTFTKEAKSEKSSSQKTLPLLQLLLQKQKLSVTDISELTVATGPGSFTGMRVGTAIAATLSFLLAIPLNGKNSPTIPLLDYQHDH